MAPLSWFAGQYKGYGILFKDALYRIWCGVNRLGDSGVNRLGDTSAFVNTAGQLLLTRRGKTRMDGASIVFNSIQPLFTLQLELNI